jgi:biopolymer transport protein ExbB
MPLLLAKGGWVFWMILVTGAVGIAVFIERLLHYHRAQINSLEFLNGVRNVLKRENIVEAVSICDATPGPVARMVKVAILNRVRHSRRRAWSRCRGWRKNWVCSPPSRRLLR